MFVRLLGDRFARALDVVRIDGNHDEGADDGHAHHDEIACGVGAGQFAEYARHQVKDKTTESIGDLEMADGLEHLFCRAQFERPKCDTSRAERHAETEHHCGSECFRNSTYSNECTEQHSGGEQHEEEKRSSKRAEFIADDAYDEFRNGQENARERDEQRSHCCIDSLGGEQDAEVVIAGNRNAAKQYECEDHRHVRSAWQRHRSEIHPWARD